MAHWAEVFCWRLVHYIGVLQLFESYEGNTVGLSKLHCLQSNNITYRPIRHYRCTRRRPALSCWQRQHARLGKPTQQSICSIGALSQDYSLFSVFFYRLYTIPSLPHVDAFSMLYQLLKCLLVRALYPPAHKYDVNEERDRILHQCVSVQHRLYTSLLRISGRRVATTRRANYSRRSIVLTWP